MSFRSRPVLDRRHRPRWQDELRSQRLIIGGFAVAIAVAVGIFGATVWNDHYGAHLRQVAYANGEAYTIDDLTKRMDAIGSELQAAGSDLQGQLGGTRDSIINQQLSVVNDQVKALVPTATESLVLGNALEHAAGRYGLAITDSELDAEIARRQSLEERMKLSVISVDALPDDAKVGDTPTDADWARAEGEAGAIFAELQGGADFATVARDKSDDPAAAFDGLIGWVQAADFQYADYFAEVTDANATAGDVIGPTRDDTGYHILRLDERRPAGPDQPLIDLLSRAGVTDTEYRAYVRSELLRQKFRDYFKTSVMTRYQPQRNVSQIFIAGDQGVPIPKQRIRHYLAQPIPGGDDQSVATDDQWAAALERANGFRDEALKPDADWYVIAADSDDPGSRSKGGDLGWYDPTSGAFVAEFEAAIAGLSVGELSLPVKTQFGYHVIQVTDTRTTAQDQADKLVARLRDDPDAFAQLAKEQSEDSSTAAKGGELGWVIPYQLEADQSHAIFEMTTPDQISDVVETGNGFWIFKLADTSDLRWVPKQQIERVRQSGFTRWIAEVRSGSQIWVDPDFTASSAA
ncbi:MAG: peptidylprolyl isomerase [Chloroflexota bacterium]|nr:peptidylprolyl isomerase [Chloroflexota bacterium]